jgi:hypothetical protein
MIDNQRWQKIKEDLSIKINEIIIPPDINPGTAKPLIAKLDALYTEVMLLYPEIKSFDDNISQLLNNTMKLAAAEGKNPDERAANAIKEATNYVLDGEPIDLFEAKQVSSQRLVFITSLIKIIEGKHGRLITTSGLMKIESNF